MMYTEGFGVLAGFATIIVAIGIFTVCIAYAKTLISKTQK